MRITGDEYQLAHTIGFHFLTPKSLQELGELRQNLQSGSNSCHYKKRSAKNVRIMEHKFLIGLQHWIREINGNRQTTSLNNGVQGGDGENLEIEGTPADTACCFATTRQTCRSVCRRLSFISYTSNILETKNAGQG